jgi:hypothetical protein
MTTQLDLFCQQKPLSNHQPADQPTSEARARYEAIKQTNRLLYLAIDQLELALDALRQAEDVVLSNIEKPQRRITNAIQDLWTTLENEQTLY